MKYPEFGTILVMELMGCLGFQTYPLRHYIQNNKRGIPAIRSGRKARSN